MVKKLELSTLLGIVVTLLLIVVAIMNGGNAKLVSFIDLPAILIVFGGTLFITIASFSVTDVVRALSGTSHTLFHNAADIKQTVSDALKLADYSKKEGILNIQKRKDLYKNMGSFFHKYIGLVMD